MQSSLGALKGEGERREGGSIKAREVKNYKRLVSVHVSRPAVSASLKLSEVRFLSSHRDWEIEAYPSQ